MSRVYSVRLSNKTLYGCYQLLKSGGTDYKDLATGTVISTAITATIEALIRTERLPAITEEDADRLVAELTTVRPNTILDEIYRMPVTKSPDVAPSQPVMEEVILPTLQETEARRAGILAALETVTNKIQAQEEEELVSEVTKKDIFRVSPDDLKTFVIRPPWEVTKLVPEEEVIEDLIYVHSPNELFKLAVRATYSQLLREKWGTKDATKLVVSTYQIFVNYKEAQNGTEV